MEKFARQKLAKHQINAMLSLIGVSALLISFSYLQNKENNKKTITLLKSIAKL